MSNLALSLNATTLLAFLHEYAHLKQKEAHQEAAQPASSPRHEQGQLAVAAPQKVGPATVRQTHLSALFSGPLGFFRQFQYCYNAWPSANQRQHFLKQTCGGTRHSSERPCSPVVYKVAPQQSAYRQ